MAAGCLTHLPDERRLATGRNAERRRGKPREHRLLNQEEVHPMKTIELLEAALGKEITFEELGVHRTFYWAVFSVPMRN